MPGTPGVYVEEERRLPTPIEGLSTTTTAFIGPTHQGPGYRGKPTVLASVTEFEQLYGGVEDLACNDAKTPELRRNHVAHAARAFFANGGTRLIVLRVGSATRLPTARSYVAALARLQAIREVALVAAPGYSARPPAVRDAIEQVLVAHAGMPGLYRMAVLDPPPRQDRAALLAWRNASAHPIDSAFAAIYTPWLTVADPLASTPGATVDLPPSGFLCGIIARCEIERGVQRAPANELVLGALGCERDINDAEQDMLNPVGINCLRTFTGRGLRVWGARTLSSASEWKYVNVRRYFNYVEASIDHGTQWAVFEPNDERLWTNFRAAVEDFLYREWRNGALQGTKPEEAYLVRCDRSTMTQADVDAGRLVCLIGLAVVRPAEFTVVRVVRQTAQG